MENVSLLHPKNWEKYGHWNYKFQTEHSSGRWNNFKYIINPDRINKSNIVVVHENIDKCYQVDKDNILIFVPGEVEANKENYPQKFLDQFDLIISTRKDIKGQNTLYSFYFHPWQVKKSFDDLISLKCPSKTKDLSAIVSTNTLKEGHKKRFEFVSALNEHLNVKFDWFAKGINYIEDKWKGLSDYKYSICIENTVQNDYFTEKISDCFLSFCLPLYYGCPNLNNFFDERSYIQIDICNLSESIEIIESAISNNLFRERYPYIQESRNLVLEKYHFIAGLSDIIGDLAINDYKKVKIKTLKPQETFKMNSISHNLKKFKSLLFRK